MKKIMLVLMVFVAGAIYARAGVTLPMQRAALAASMAESADAYAQAGNQKKAAEYRKAALAFYPVGDQAHIMANQLGVTLNDEETFNKFVMQADRSMKNRDYSNALSDYLMALEIRQPVEVYQKLIATYQALGNREMADGLRALVNAAPTQSSIPATAAPMARPAPRPTTPQEEYQAEAVQDPVYNDEAYEEEYSDTFENDEPYEAEEATPAEVEEAIYQESEVMTD